MKNFTRWTICTCAAAILAAPLLLPPELPFSAAPAHAQSLSKPKAHRGTAKTQAPAQAPPPAPAALSEPPPRVAYTAADAAAAAIPGIPEARFWGNSVSDFTAALPSQPGPWLALSSGGEDGAFGAGLLTGLTASGKRPDFAVVTGVSTGALMAPFVFAGPKYDDALRNAYTTITSADIYEAGRTSEAFADSWPLRDLIAKEITPDLFKDIANAYRGGRRLFVVSYDLDAERAVVWNMGAIAAHGGDDALKLFRTVLLASASIPGAFPPTLIDVEANGKKFQEMHVDGGVGGQFFVAPAALMAATSDYHLPATALYVVINTDLKPEFQVVDRFVPTILTQAVGAAVNVDTRLMLDRAYSAAKRSGVPFNAATVPASFTMPSRGAFDPDYMKALFNVGVEQGKSAVPFANEPPPPPDRLQIEATDPKPIDPKSTDPKPTDPQPGGSK
jgi:predicted acylesterase/phospholipase RssA